MGDNKMRAVRIDKPGELKFVDVPIPKVAPGHVLVRVKAVGVCMSDLEIFEGTRPPEYVRYPITPGHEWCGEVVEVGPDVARLRAGDRVAVEGHNFCGSCYFCAQGQTNLCQSYNEFGFTLDGAYSEYVLVREDLAHAFAATLAWECAALTEPAACAGHGMMRAGVRPGDTVCVIGPGTIGLLGVAWARALGAKQIVVAGLDRANEALARAAGATHYLEAGGDVVAQIQALTAGRGADVVFESAGAVAAVSTAFEAVRRGGNVVLMGIAGGNRALTIPADMFALKDARVHGVFAYTSQAFEETLRNIERGTLNVLPLVTHRMPLGDVRRALALMRDKREPVAKIMLQP